MKILSIVTFSIVIILCNCQGKIAPLMPEEFAANQIQNKYNQNGFGVNHTCFGTYLQSYQMQKIRSDCTGQGMASNNMSIPSPIQSQVMISIMDFNVNPPQNTYITWDSISQAPSCWSGVPGYIAPFKSTFLRDIGAVYTGQEITSQYGICEKWSFLMQTTTFTFYFDSQQHFVRYDFFSLDPQQGQVGVSTLFFNIEIGQLGKQLFDQNVFAGVGSCPNFTIPFGSQQQNAQK